jgi:hypothetical protein
VKEQAKDEVRREVIVLLNWLHRGRAILRLLFFCLLVALCFSLPGPASAQWQHDGVLLSTLPSVEQLPMIVGDGQGGAIIVWQDFRGGPPGDIYAQRLDHLGHATWTANGVLVWDSHVQWEHVLYIVPDDAGGAIIMWTSFPGFIKAQRIGEQGSPLWETDGITVGPANYVRAAVTDGSGGVIVAYGPKRLARINAQGVIQWQFDPAPPFGGAGNTEILAVTGDGLGGAIVMGHAQLYEDTTQVFRAFRVSAAGNWFQDGADVCESCGGFSATSDGTGGAVIAYLRTSQDNNTQIFAQRLSADGLIQWQPGGIALCTNPSNQTPLQLEIAGGTGDVVVAWIDERDGPSASIYGQRVSLNGVLEWQSDGSLLSTTPGGSEMMRVVRDESGGAILSWMVGTQNERDIYAQHVNAAGLPLGPVDGIPVCTSAGDQTYPEVAADGEGGAIVTWNDVRNGVSVYAQRVGDSMTSIGDGPRLGLFQLGPNYPNPFSGQTQLEVRLPDVSDVRVEVFDIAGHKVREKLLAGLTAGTHPLSFNGRDGRGRQLPSGVYFFRVHASGSTITRKIVIAR